MSEKLSLLGIMLLGLAIRIVSWQVQGFTGSESEFETMARSIVQGDWSTYLSNNRAHQPVYPLLLTPVYLFEFDLATYTFVLHSLLACGTIYLVYRIARRLFGTTCGLMSALLVAANLMIALWFPWMTGDTPFHFFLALFAISAVRVWEQHRPRDIFLFAACSMLCMLSRPEGLFVAVVASSVLIYRILSNSLSAWAVVTVILTALLTCAAVLTATLYYNQPVRELFFSNMHVAYPLYVSSRTITGSPQEELQTYSSTGPVVDKARQQPGFVSPNYALAMVGLRFIKENPLTWAGRYFVRLTSIVFPSVFSPWWSVKNRIYSFTLSVVLVVGSLIGCVLGGARRFQATGVTLLGLTIAFTISLFQREMDYRVPVSMHVLLACVAPFGWIGAMRSCAEWRSNA